MIKKRTVASVLIILVLAASLFALAACDDETPVIETRFAVNMDETSVWGLGGTVLGMAIDADRSGITLRSDGTMQLDLILNNSTIDSLLPVIGPILEGMLVDEKGENIIDSFVASYIQPIMPGFTFDDIDSSLALAENALGVSFVSDDAAETDAFIDVLAEVLTTAELPDVIDIPEGFGLRVESTYYVKDVVYPDGTVYKGVYLTPTDPDTQPYVVFDLSENGDGGYRLNLKVDFIQLNLVADEVLPEAEESTEQTA